MAHVDEQVLGRFLLERDVVLASSCWEALWSRPLTYPRAQCRFEIPRDVSLDITYAQERRRAQVGLKTVESYHIKTGEYSGVP